jgi:alpha-beta hydrolase superfamily lysophospholipase
MRAMNIGLTGRRQRIAMSPQPIVAFDLATPDGFHVTAYRSFPTERPKAIVQLAHGMAEHLARYRRLTAELTGAGYVVYGNDHRGHGASAAAHGLGDFGPGGFQALVDDMAALSRRAQMEQPNLPLVLVGHSMGSFAAQLYLLGNHTGLAGLVLSGTAAVDALAEAIAARGVAAAPNAMNAPFAPARTDFDWLSRDEAEVDAYIADPLCGFPLTEAAMTSVFATAGAARHDPRLASVRPDLPVYVISGEFDPVTGPGQAFANALIDTYRGAGLAAVDHRVYPGGRHEMFNETSRGDVTAELIAWLDRTVAPGASAGGNRR